MESKVFKFGGASIKDASGIRTVSDIIQKFNDQKITCVVSAAGKTTNALETVVNAYVSQSGQANDLLQEVKVKHLEIIKECGISDETAIADIMDSFVEIDWVIEDEQHDEFNYIYDQIVSVGEIVSSKILYYFLKTQDVKAIWLDVRDVLFTDEIHREAKVDWNLTVPKINERVNLLFEKADIIVTQGFIGSTTDNHTTTLGREGSDYTAAIFSYCSDATGMHIWKDVPGVLTGDPTIFENVTKIDRLSYKEAVEMTYYGAKVIHPKTIKPIQNKSIPLYVRPFKNPESEGTIISGEGEISYPPIVVIEPNQCLLHISVNDFSFVAEHHMSNIFSILAELRIKVNLMRNTAISFSICVQEDETKIAILKERLKDEFTVVHTGNLELITIRHFNKEIIKELKEGKLTIFEENLNDMVQIVVKDIPTIKRK